MTTSPDPVTSATQPLPSVPPSPSYRSEIHKGVEIRTRCSKNPRNYLWTGSYSFFTRTIAHRGNDRICRDLADKFPTEEAAISACFKAGRVAVDVEILTSLPRAPLPPIPAPPTGKS